MNKYNIRKTILINTRASFFLQIISIISGLILPRLILSHFGSVINGTITSITQILSYVALVDGGFGSVGKAALYKAISTNDNKQIVCTYRAVSRFYKKISYIFILVICTLCIFYPFVLDNGYDYYFNAELILILGTSTFFDYYIGLALNTLLQADQKVWFTSYLQAGTIVLNTISTWVLILVGADIRVIKVCTVLINLLRPLVMMIYANKAYHIRECLDSEECVPVLNQRWAGLAQHTAFFVHKNTDIVLITLFLNIKEVSVYSIYTSIVFFIDSLVATLSSGFTSTLGISISKKDFGSVKKIFNSYEFLVFTVAGLLYIPTLFLLKPFVLVYTRGVYDINYSRPVFSIVIVLAEFMYSLRYPYSSMVFSDGRFKETKWHAYIEVLVNIFLSIGLIRPLGILGVAIGTLCAMTVRLIFFVMYVNKKMLYLGLLNFVKKMLAILLSIILTGLASGFIQSHFIVVNNYGDWIIFACIITSINFVFYILSLYILSPNDVIALYRQIRNEIIR